MWRREEREEREIAKKEEDKEIEFIMKSTGRVCVQRISFLLISNWRGFRSHSLNLTLYINIYFSFNYCYTYIPTLPCTTFPFYPLISCQWSGNPILGFPYSTPILPQRLLVLRLTNKFIKRFGNSGFEKHDLKMGTPSIIYRPSSSLITGCPCIVGVGFQHYSSRILISKATPNYLTNTLLS